MDRTAIANPAGPMVSWPTTSWASATASSFARCEAPPTRIEVMTNDDPSIAGSGVVAVVIFTPSAIRDARPAMVRRRS
jgi:hypothetical protein